LARLLIKKGHRVRGLTRNPDSPSAQGLQQLGAELVAGNFEDQASLERAATGMDAVFTMATPFEGGPEAETRQGNAVADAAKAAGVGHLVYSSVANADKNTGIPHFESKYKIEQHIETLGIPYTIIAPVYFMENLLAPFALPQVKQGQLAIALPTKRELQQVALQDIVSFAALVLERRERFPGSAWTSPRTNYRAVRPQISCHVPPGTRSSISRFRSSRQKRWARTFT
jgi:uncharacterized protein YbjT (DUF2867 family)